MRRVDYIVASREFKGLIAWQFMQEVVYAYHPEGSAETLAQIMTEKGGGPVYRLKIRIGIDLGWLANSIGFMP
ncbi:MAG: hypothetical protein AB7T38_18705 [Nitrospirales bacterium]